MRNAASKVGLGLTLLAVSLSTGETARAQQEEASSGVARMLDGQRLSLARTHHIIEGHAQTGPTAYSPRFGMLTVLMPSPIKARGKLLASSMPTSKPTSAFSTSNSTCAPALPTTAASAKFMRPRESRPPIPPGLWKHRSTSSGPTP